MKTLGAANENFKTIIWRNLRLYDLEINQMVLNRGVVAKGQIVGSKSLIHISKG